MDENWTILLINVWIWISFYTCWFVYVNLPNFEDKAWEIVEIE